MAKFITSLPGVGGATAAILNKHGFRAVEDIANASPESLSAVPGFRASRAAKIIMAARAILAEEQAVKTAEVKKPSRVKTMSDEAASKAVASEAKSPKVKAPKSPKPPKDEAPAILEVKEKPAKVAKVAKTVVDELPKVKAPKAPKAPQAETVAQPLEDPVKPAKSGKKAKVAKSKEKKVNSDKTAGKGKKTK
ncbi:MAG: helix-hairpin-helix domain-containing protein [Chromatiaceae bacterium]